MSASPGLVESQLARALERIAELEAQLEVLTQGREASWRPVSRVLGVTPVMASLLVGLLAHPEGASLLVLDGCIPESLGQPGQRTDPALRTLGAVQQQVYRIRRALPGFLTTGSRLRGVALTDEGRAAVQRALASRYTGDAAK